MLRVLGARVAKVCARAHVPGRSVARMSCFRQSIQRGFAAAVTPPLASATPLLLSESSDVDATGEDFEVRDATIIFKHAISDLEKQYGRENLKFPKEIIWLAGAPGSGKGTMTPYILEERHMSQEIVMSDLLNSENAKKYKETGGFVPDAEVVRILLQQLLRPEMRRGVVVDGFPRTPVQCDIVRMLHDHMHQLRREFLDTPLRFDFRRPCFRCIVLFVTEKDSIDRQTHRGEKMEKSNQFFAEANMDQISEVRNTDRDLPHARKRYRYFKEITYPSLKNHLAPIFPYHFIDASGSVESVRKQIVNELQYQSSLELDETTVELFSDLPTANVLTSSCRQRLVERLDRTARSSEALFRSVVECLKSKVYPVLYRQALSGEAVVRLHDPLFESTTAKRLAIDLMTERGFHVVLDEQSQFVPESVDTISQKIRCKVHREYVFHVTFKKTTIRKSELLEL